MNVIFEQDSKLRKKEIKHNILSQIPCLKEKRKTCKRNSVGEILDSF
jgi:hypothetical protein